MATGGLRRPGSRQTAERYLPLAYFAMAFVLVAVLLPTVLRPPQTPPTQTAELSPDAPADPNNPSIISSFTRGATITAGTPTDEIDDVGLTPVSVPPTVAKPRRGRCFGNPPRQYESVYAPPCAPAFTGNNGGATSRGVTATEIRIGLMMELTGTVATDGPISPTERAGESDAERTYRVLMAYFNQRLELYGRQVRFYYTTTPSGRVEEAGQRARAAKADEEQKVFGVVQETKPAEIDELTRRKIVTFTLAQVPQSFYESRRPYLWSFTPDATKMLRMGADYLCKKLIGRPPVFTDDPTFDKSKPRKFGIIVYDSLGAYRDNAADYLAFAKQQCGLNETTVQVVRYTVDENGVGDYATAMSRMKVEGVTTIIYLGELVSAFPFTNSAESSAYRPEWFIPGFGGVDTDQRTARAYNGNQWNHAFGFSLYEMPFADNQRECYAAYRTIDLTSTPDRGICYQMWGHLVQLTGGLQAAGPNLTPESFEKGLFGQPKALPKPNWRMAGGFGPGDYTYPDYAAEIWWDPAAPHPDGMRGGYRYVRGGQRYGIGEFPKEDPLVFNDGVVTQDPNAP